MGNGAVALGTAVAVAAVGGGLAWYYFGQGKSKSPKCTNSSVCSSACPNGTCPGGFTCVSGQCVSGGTGQPCSVTNPCPAGYTCVNGYCEVCSGSCATPSDCACQGPDYTGCSPQGQCYVPVIQVIKSNTGAVLITANMYKSQQCCEYDISASVTTCGKCSRGCGPGLPTAGESATFTVFILDQYGLPYVGANVTATAVPLTNFGGSWGVIGANSGTTTETTDRNGDATFRVVPNHIPDALASVLSIPDCTSTACVPLVGICYCNGGSTSGLNPLQESGVPAGQVNLAVAGVSQQAPPIIVEMLPYGKCSYLGQVPPALSGGCQGACP